MAEPWIRVHQHLSDRPVAHRLAILCRGDVHKACGHLITFWGNVVDHAHDGYIRDVPDTQLEKWAEWNGKRGAFARWVRDKHMDEDGRVPEWDEYMGALETRREKDRRRKAELRARDRARRQAETSIGSPADSPQDAPQDSPQDVPQTSAPARANGTVRDGTEEKTATTTAAATARAAIDLTVAANRATTDIFGEQPSPILASSGKSHELAEAVLAAGIPIDFAQRSIARQVAALSKPVRTLSYFRAGILDDFEKHEARRAAQAAGPVAPLEIPRDRRSTRAMSATEIIEQQLARERQQEHAS